MNHWLFKSEPETFSVDHLAGKPGSTDGWDGVRNYQARNFMRDRMRKGDLGFFYHSNCAEPGIVGIVTVTGEARVDPTQFDKKSKYFDPKSDHASPRWWLVDVTLKRKLARTITLAELKEVPGLAGMQLLKKGNRLSVMPVTGQEWNAILALE